MEPEMQLKENNAEVKPDEIGDSFRSSYENKVSKEIVLLVIIPMFVVLIAALYFLLVNKYNSRPFAKKNTEVVKDKETEDAVIDNKTTGNDQDGFSDYLENIFGTSENNFDTDSDGYTDLQEIKSGYSPLVAGSAGKYSLEEWDLIKEKIKNKDKEFYEKEFGFFCCMM